MSRHSNARPARSSQCVSFETAATIDRHRTMANSSQPLLTFEFPVCRRVGPDGRPELFSCQDTLETAAEVVNEFAKEDDRPHEMIEIPLRGSLPTICESPVVSPDIRSGHCDVTLHTEDSFESTDNMPEGNTEAYAQHLRSFTTQGMEAATVAALTARLEAHCREQARAAVSAATSEAKAAHTEMFADMAAVSAAVQGERRQREDALMALQRDLLTLTDSAVRERGLIEELYKEVEALRIQQEARTVSSPSTSCTASSNAAGAAPAAAANACTGSTGRLLEETRRSLADFEAGAMKDLDARFEALQGQAKEALTGIASQKDMLASMIERSVAELCAALTLQQQEEMQRLREQIRAEVHQMVDVVTPQSTSTLCSPSEDVAASSDASTREAVSERKGEFQPLADLKQQMASLQQDVELLRKNFSYCLRVGDASADKAMSGIASQARAQVSHAGSSIPIAPTIAACGPTDADARPDLVVLQNLRQLQQQLFEQFAEIEAERDARVRDAEELRAAVTSLHSKLENATAARSTGSTCASSECQCSGVAAQVEDLRKQEECRVGELCAQALAGWEEGHTENVVLLEQGLASLRDALASHIADSQEHVFESQRALQTEQDERHQTCSELQAIVSDSSQRIELLESDYIDITRTLKRLDIKVRELPRRQLHASSSEQKLSTDATVMSSVARPRHSVSGLGSLSRGHLEAQPTFNEQTRQTPDEKASSSHAKVSREVHPKESEETSTTVVTSRFAPPTMFRPEMRRPAFLGR